MDRPIVSGAMFRPACLPALLPVLIGLALPSPLPAADTADPAQTALVQRGQALFGQLWSMAPSAFGRWGRGPTSNGEACTDCHAEGGRGRPPRAGEPLREGVVRLSVATAQGVQAHPVYGEQLQSDGVLGKVPGEGEAILDWSEHVERFEDDGAVSLRRPRVRFVALAFGAIAPDTMISLRIAPPLHGVASFEQVDRRTLERLVAAQASMGLAGRFNQIAGDGGDVPGRFGLKSNQPTLIAQIASALHQDLGVTSPLYPQENCPAAQDACSRNIAGAQPEIAQDELEALAAYLRSLSPPAARPLHDPAVERGRALFAAAGCAGCHRAELPLSTGAGSIHAYTDLLVHDLGDGLADGRPDGEAGARDWRTAPLWGLGGQGDDMVLLHDGRARSIAEAILWHGGEARPARERFRSMRKSDREALEAFLRSL